MSLHQFDLTRSPGLVEPRLGRTIETQNAKPAFVGNRLKPVGFFPGRCLGAEVDIDRSILVGLKNVLVLLIVVAGPCMNFLLPFVLLPVVFMIGISVPAYLERSPVIGQIAAGSPAAEAGFLVGDKILEIEGSEVSNWRDVNIQLQTNPAALHVLLSILY